MEMDYQQNYIQQEEQIQNVNYNEIKEKQSKNGRIISFSELHQIKYSGNIKQNLNDIRKDQQDDYTSSQNQNFTKTVYNTEESNLDEMLQNQLPIDIQKMEQNLKYQQQSYEKEQEEEFIEQEEKQVKQAQKQTYQQKIEQWQKKLKQAKLLNQEKICQFYIKDTEEFSDLLLISQLENTQSKFNIQFIQMILNESWKKKDIEQFEYPAKQDFFGEQNIFSMLLNFENKAALKLKYNEENNIIIQIQLGYIDVIFYDQLVFIQMLIAKIVDYFVIKVKKKIYQRAENEPYNSYDYTKDQPELNTQLSVNLCCNVWTEKNSEGNLENYKNFIKFLYLQCKLAQYFANKVYDLLRQFIQKSMGINLENVSSQYEKKSERDQLLEWSVQQIEDLKTEFENQYDIFEEELDYDIFMEENN